MPRLDCFNNTEGLNLTDSPFYVKDGQATGGANYDYVRTGGISKRRGLSAVNTIANAQSKTFGLGIHNTSSGTKTVVRAAGTKIQTVDLDAALFTDLSEDTAAVNSTFLDSTSTQPVVSVNFNTTTNNMLWLAGAGASSIYGYNGTKVTANGVAAPTGTFIAANQGTGTGGSGWTNGTYYYALVLRKASTQALSNAALDQSVTIASATDSVLLTFPTGVDATKYDKWYIYRSSVSGVSGFTAGSLVAQVTVGTATYTDLNVTLASSQVVPRSGNIVLDNSPLDAGTYKSLMVWKRQLVTASNSTIHISDQDKPESWPAGKKIVIPTGGAITGLSVIGYNTTNTQSTDEYLVVFKERETWVITGTGVLDSDTELYDVELKFLDNVGCANQSLAVPTGGFIAWIDYRGVYLWNGADKPVYVSRTIEAMFDTDGDLDKIKLSQGWGSFYRKKNQIIWTLSSRSNGANKMQIKLDLRLTAGKVANGITANSIVEGVFMPDSLQSALYGGTAYLPSDNEELLLVGDDAGFVYKHYYGVSDNGSGIDFSYRTKAFDCGTPTEAKSFQKVVVYIEQTTNKDLTLKYWAQYRVLESERSEIQQNMQTTDTRTGSLWDLANWDVALWDEGINKPVALVYNLSSNENNCEGDSLMLEFSQDDPSAPVTILGFSIYYENLAVRK